jgi:hypothetical protein
MPHRAGTLTPKQKHAIAALQGLGGSMRANGRSLIPADEQNRVLGMKSMAIASMEKAGIIKRELKGKATKSITLLEPFSSMQIDGVKAPRKRNPAARPAYKSQRRSRHVPSLPLVGQTLTVCGVLMHRDESIELMLRNGSESWITTVQGHAVEEALPTTDE